MASNQKLGSAELLYLCASSMGLHPTWLVRGSICAISTPSGEYYLHDAKSSINSQLSSSLTRNKYSTRLVLERNGLPNIPFLKPTSLYDAQLFLAQHAKIIVKPLSGSNSHGVHIVETLEQLQALSVRQCILEKYIAGAEWRYLVLNNKVIGVHKSEYGESVSSTRDLERISYPASAWDQQLAKMALKTASVLGLRYTAVDYLINAQGKAYILEVNSSPGMKWFHAPTSGPKIDVARMLLESMLEDIDASTPDPLETYPLVAYS